MEDIQLPYGIKDGKLFHISQVKSGLACGCVCPFCDAKLVARKGKEVAIHFAHYSGTSCSGATETALHLAAKDILEDKKHITLPTVCVKFKSGYRPTGKSRIYKIDSVHAEKKLGNIIPDLILEIKQRKLLVEVFVTHKVGREKLNKIKELGISAIEIDLSSAHRDMPMEILTELIVNGTDNKKWLNNERANLEYKKLMDKAIRKKLVRSGWSDRVENCPKKMHKWRGNYVFHPRLNYCLKCEYCLETEPDTGSIEYICCIGHIQDAFKEY